MDEALYLAAGVPEGLGGERLPGYRACGDRGREDGAGAGGDSMVPEKISKRAGPDRGADDSACAAMAVRAAEGGR